jgi:hypothetical protein
MSILIQPLSPRAARRFLDPYHNVFTTNYDLLLYWTILQQGAAGNNILD